MQSFARQTFIELQSVSQSTCRQWLVPEFGHIVSGPEQHGPVCTETCDREYRLVESTHAEGTDEGFFLIRSFMTTRHTEMV